MVDLSHLRRSDFHYDLPENYIARYPLPVRDQSRLLVYQDGNIHHNAFHQLSDFLPANSLLVFNDTKVIPARLHFRRATGALIEVLLLHPILPREVHLAMQAVNKCEWQCMVGNKKRWKPDEKLELSLPSGVLTASWSDRETNHVSFEWETSHAASFAEILQMTGNIPLPPYLNRSPTEQDRKQYQTVYAQHDGAVAAPTAGLHFTPNVFKSLRGKKIEEAYISLHVGAGTFLPVKESTVANHQMHAEQIVVPYAQLKLLRRKLGHIIAVGTTSARLLESLYWMGLNRMLKQDHAVFSPSFQLDQFAPYTYTSQQLFPASEVLDYLIDQMEVQELESLWGSTSLFIVPGYSFQLCRGLITNFHLPESTLIMLVAALVGDDWRKIYGEALENSYRFLSYGDSSLLLP